MKCRKCNSENYIKSGNHLGRQRYKCKECGFQYTKEESNQKPSCEKAMAVTLYIFGLSFRSIGKILNISHQSILNWVRDFGLKTFEKPKPSGAVVVELDEMWHFIKKKNKNYGYGKLIVALPVSSLTGNVAIVIKKH